MIKDMLKLSLPLVVICAVAAIALSKINELTAEPIARAQMRAERDAVEAVLPAFVELRSDTLAVDGARRVYYRGVDGGEVTGSAFRSLSGIGYSGEIEIMVGVGSDGAISGVRILQHAETPGLGANYAAPEVLDAFYKGRPVEGVDWRVKKDGGEIDAVTGATVTGRALVDAIGKGLANFAADAPNLPAPAEAAPQPGADQPEPASSAPAQAEMTNAEIPAQPVPETEEAAR